MSTESKLSDYENMVMLLKSPEWLEWVRFLRARTVTLKDKVLRHVRNKEYDDALKVVAVIDDIDTQIELFKSRKRDLENELSK